MTTELPMYGEVSPVNNQKHLNYSVDAGVNFNFARELNSVPLMAVEFPNAGAEYAIVFAGDDQNLLPVVLMGVREKENLYVDEQGKWEAQYIPAFVRRYPFVFSTDDKEEILTLCIDEAFEGVNEQGEGERLFTDEGEQTEYLNSIVEFLKEYQIHYKRTREFTDRLLASELLEPMEAQFTTPAGETRKVHGFRAVNRDKLKELSAFKLTELMKLDEMELIYVHLQSMRNLNRILEKIGTQEVAEGGAQVEPEIEEQQSADE